MENPGQALPWRHLRLLVLFPPPQLREHLDQADHEDHVGHAGSAHVSRREEEPLQFPSPSRQVRLCRLSAVPHVALHAVTSAHSLHPHRLVLQTWFQNQRSFFSQRTIRLLCAVLVVSLGGSTTYTFDGTVYPGNGVLPNSLFTSLLLNATLYFKRHPFK